MAQGKEKMKVRLANHVNYDNPLAASTDGLDTAATMADGNVSIGGTQPDAPRNIILTVSAATVVGGTVTVYGIDQNGVHRSEVFTMNGALTYNGSIAWSKVLQVTVADLDSAGTETLALGLGDKLGLPVGPHGKLVEVFLACAAGAAEAVGTVSKDYATIDPTTATDNSADFDFWYSYDVDLL